MMVLRKIKNLFLLIFCCGIYEFTSNYLINNNFINIFIILNGLLLCGWIFFLKFQLKAKWFQVLLYFLVVCLFSGYFLYVIWNPLLQKTLFFSDIVASEQQVISFLTIFSLAYGISQLYGGFIISKFKFFGLNIMMILGAICLYAHTWFPDINLCIKFRFFSGVFFSVTGIIISYYATQFWPKNHLSIVINTMNFLSMMLANNLLKILLKINIIEWKTMFRGVSVAIIGLSIVFLILINFNQSNVNEQISQNNEIKTNLWQEFSLTIKKNHQIIILCLISAFLSMNFFFLRTSGYYVDLIRNLYPKNDPFLATNLLNAIVSYLVLLTPILLSIFLDEVFLIIASCVTVFCSFTLFFLAKNSIIFILLHVFGCSLAIAAQMSIFTILGKEFGKLASIGLILGMLNFFSMFFGSYLGQKLGMLYVNQSWIRNGSIMLNGKAVISSIDILYGLKCLFFAPLLALVLAIYLFKLKRTKQKNNQRINYKHH